MNFVNLEQASRATLIAFQANIPISWWGSPGVGKSSAIQQITDRLEDDYEIFDLRLSDKEPSDVGGIPFPGEEEIVDPVTGKKSMRRVLEFLVTKLLPFDSHKKAIVLLDEFDRADISVQNAALQLVLDRKVNGHKLSENARLVLAGNSSTDIGTSPLSGAAANRMCHLYIDIATPSALQGWLKWAEQNEISPLLQGFASQQLTVFAGGDQKQKKLEELAYPTPRSFVYADRLLKEAGEMPFDTEDILPALVAGCVGKAAAATFLAYRDIYHKLPTMEQVIADPENVALPRNPSVLYAYKRQLTLWAAGDEEAAKQIAKYVLRWEDEPAADFFRMLKEAQPDIVNSDAWKLWHQKRNRPGMKEEVDAQSPSTTVHEAWCANCREKHEINNPTLKTMQSGKKAIVGTCSKCGSDVFTTDLQGRPNGANHAPVKVDPAGIPVLQPDAAKLLAKKMGGSFEGDQAQWKNRIKISSDGGIRRYTLSQLESTGKWHCSCQGFVTHKTCKHHDRLLNTLSNLGR